LNVIFALNHDAVTDAWRTQSKPTSGSGSVSGRVYIDENNDNKMEGNDKIYSDAKININHVPYKPDGDDYFAAPVSPYQVNHVELDVSSIEDPLLTPTIKDYNVITRPGDNVIVDFPLVRTTIVDGTVSFVDDKGDKHELSNIVVELDDKLGKPVQRVISAIDGYFSFDKVRAGEYWLNVPDEALASFNAILDKKIPIMIEKVDDFMTGNEITLHQKAKLDVPPPLPALPQPPASPPAPQAPPDVPKTADIPAPETDEKVTAPLSDVQINP
jgi:hypothetical protein